MRQMPAAELLAIHGSLRRLFPQNVELAHRWLCTPNRIWSRRPIEVILERGVEGARELRAYLERAG